ncbi:Ribonucleoside-diphosphate reductase [Nitrosococcus halophilus Nc 4]|uniref:Ribonucleoside-diphosphate reductase n=2 Tax=Nitrosococcus halophilus TaxID=133539 RepID=D5BWU6_NITHN|nr:ribonucleoside-diphosphate reductase subunit alpha [Nitrosococcus halophilus]ADE13827.1 Ribonucleoside-diphosphate reductase [Nitrosococcus halophilus Nc 4]
MLHGREQSPDSESLDPTVRATAPGQYRVIRRNGKVTGFDPSKIAVAMTKAFLAVEGGSAATSKRIHQTVEALTAQVVEACTRRLETGGTVHIEDIQDQVELALMRGGYHKIARAYVLYREERTRERAQAAAKTKKKAAEPPLQMTLADGRVVPLDKARLTRIIEEACQALPETQPQTILNETLRNLFDGVAEQDVERALIMSARTFIEKEPHYSYVAARLLLDSLRREALSFIHGAETHATQGEMAERYPEYFAAYIKQGADLQLIDPRLTQYDLTRLGQALRPERDFEFTYLGLQTLYDRYFIHSGGIRFELPQAFFMRVAMGLAINEVEREERTIEFYELLSSFDFMSSTPTLFNSGSLRPQLSSCYLTTVADDLDGIYSAIKDNALLSKYAGGLGNDWTRVRGMGAHIKGTNGKSQGVVPFLKVANDTAVAVNQCFAPDTLVHTAEGVTPIKAIQAGDLVLSQCGEYREVTRKLAYNQTEAMVELHIKHSIEPVQVTAGHPFWALRGVPMEQSNDRTLSWLAHGKIQPEWVEAGKLSKGDYVAQVIPKEIVPVADFTEDDAHLYGILLGDGHSDKRGEEWGVSGNPQQDHHLQFVRRYLEVRGIHYWEINRGTRYVQIRWASGRGVIRNATTGRIVGAGAPTLPFTRDDLYDHTGNKRIHRRFSHLPRRQTLALVQGLLETDGGVSRNKEIYFTSTSFLLAEGLRYQLLRLGVPTAGQYRERYQNHRGRRSDGSEIRFDGICRAVDVRIPAVAEIAERLGCRALTKRNWIEYGSCLFTRIRSVRDIDPLPFVYDLKVEGDPSYMTTAALVHNGGKRKGAVCAYLETWHIDIEEFLELRKNTGDDRRRTHDMNTANWVPDLFMKRVAEDGEWTLFSPDETPDLHDLVGQAFEEAYLRYEEKAACGEIKNFKKQRAVDLWRKMLSMLFETGHPWITFKDPCNLRSPQQHAGVVHSSNLCCIAADQRVVTDRGLLTVGELYRLGGKNKVVGLDGIYDASEMLLPRPNAPMVEIQTEEGYTHKITPDHKVWVKDRGWVEAQHLAPGDKLLTQQIEGLWGHQHDPDLSYLMGLIAGDGTFGNCNVHLDVWSQDFTFLKPIEEKTHTLLDGNAVLRTTSTNSPAFYLNTERKRARLSSAPLKRILEENGFTKETKLRIPELVWQGDRETAAAYLRGLYQADGHIQASREVTSMVFASHNKEFIRELQILWANFGVKTSINQMRGHRQQLLPDGRGGKRKYWVKPLYRLLITSIQGCRIAEDITHLAEHKANTAKAARYFLDNINKEGYQQKLWATFSGLKHLPNEDAYCLTVDSTTHAWTVNGLITKNTEITLNTSDDEIAVCNLGSINLPQHLDENGLNLPKLEKTITTAMRMLDNVIDYNYYSVPTARRSNLRHRPVGLGLMGFQDALYKLRLPYASEAAVEFADRSMEAISYYAIKASSNLAGERGKYCTFEGSLWSKGILPIDSIGLLEQGRGGYLQQDRTQTLDWDGLREQVKTVGMRNSNCMAIAPTATISNICGVSQSIEPTYQNLFVKSNLSGEFTVINPYLVQDLKARDLWDEVMVNDLKYFDGSVQPIDRIPEDLKTLYATAFEIDPRWLVEAASRRQKWLDQAQSLNLYMAEPSGKKLDNLYKLAWVRGLKTTYYLRSLGATHVEKSTMTSDQVNTLNAVQSGSPQEPESEAPQACSILDPDCEACQ